MRENMTTFKIVPTFAAMGGALVAAKRPKHGEG
jgi:hypothetical protein